MNWGKPLSRRLIGSSVVADGLHMLRPAEDPAGESRLKVLGRCLAGCCLLLLHGGNAQAAAISFGLPDIVVETAVSSDRAIGYSFTTNQTITITHLGVYDSLAPGMSNTSHTVGLWTSTGGLLAQASPGTYSPLVGLFRYEDITDIVLAANTTYVIGAAQMGTSYSSDAWLNLPTGLSSFTVDPRITLGSARYVGILPWDPLQFPGSIDAGSLAYVGPNFLMQEAVVPVPAAVWLFGSALGVMGVVRHKRRS